jgi:hypothetical protein
MQGNRLRRTLQKRSLTAGCLFLSQEPGQVNGEHDLSLWGEVETLPLLHYRAAWPP